MRMWLILIACAMGLFSVQVRAQEPTGIALGEFLQRLALRRPERMPEAFRSPGKKRKIQLALVIDATATMEKEIVQLAERLPDLQKIFGITEPHEEGTFEWSIVLYRDTEATSGPTTILERGSSKTQVVMGKLSTVKGESAEPYPNNLVDQGLHQALSELAWKVDDETERHLILIGDSPAYGGGTSFRKYPTDQLLKLAKEKKVRIHAIQPATIAAEPDSAAEARRNTNLFYSLVCGPTGGFQIDLTNSLQVEACLGRAVQVEGLDDKLIESIAKPSLPATAETETTKVWEEFARPYAKDVVNQRDLAQALAACNLHRPAGVQEPFNAELLKHAATLELAVEDSNDRGPLHLHCALAYDRLAGLGVYNLAAQKRSLYAWLAAERVAKPKESSENSVSESLIAEINAFKKLHVDNDPTAALPLLERVIELKDEKTNPGSIARARYALIRLEMTHDASAASPENLTEEKPAAEKPAESEKAPRDRIGRQIETLLREFPRTPVAIALAGALTRDADKRLWLHEDFLHATY